MSSLKTPPEFGKVFLTFERWTFPKTVGETGAAVFALVYPPYRIDRTGLLAFNHADEKEKANDYDNTHLVGFPQNSPSVHIYTCATTCVMVTANWLGVARSVHDNIRLQGDQYLDVTETVRRILRNNWVATPQSQRIQWIGDLQNCLYPVNLETGKDSKGMEVWNHLMQHIPSVSFVTGRAVICKSCNSFRFGNFKPFKNHTSVGTKKLFDKYRLHLSEHVFARRQDMIEEMHLDTPTCWVQVFFSVLQDSKLGRCACGAELFRQNCILDRLPQYMMFSSCLTGWPNSTVDAWMTSPIEIKSVTTTGETLTAKYKPVVVWAGKRGHHKIYTNQYQTAEDDSWLMFDPKTYVSDGITKVSKAQVGRLEVNMVVLERPIGVGDGEVPARHSSIHVLDYPWA